jgi:hypothetical protein
VTIRTPILGVSSAAPLMSPLNSNLGTKFLLSGAHATPVTPRLFRKPLAKMVRIN